MKPASLPTTGLVKSVEWSYPSSPNACAAGFGKVGCWTVSLQDPTGSASPQAVSHHTDRQSALVAARALSAPWGFAFRHCHPQDAGTL